MANFTHSGRQLVGPYMTTIVGPSGMAPFGRGNREGGHLDAEQRTSYAPIDRSARRRAF